MNRQKTKRRRKGFTINEELAKHDTRLSEVYQILVLNKIDTISQEDKENLYDEFKQVADDIFMISAATKQGVNELLNFMANKVDEIPKPEIEVEVEDDDAAFDNDDSAFSIYKVDKNSFVIEGGKLFRLANVTDARNAEQIYRFQNILKAMGVFEALIQAGAKDGDNVKIGHIEFDYYE